MLSAFRVLTESQDVEEAGWKQLHGDVFRAPQKLTLFAALVGIGYQFAILVFAVLVFAMLGAYYRTRGTIITALVVGYALSSFIAGYVSGGYYLRCGGEITGKLSRSVHLIP